MGVGATALTYDTIWSFGAFSINDLYEYCDDART